MNREEFLKFKNQSISNLELEQKTQQGIDQAERGLGIRLDDVYVDKGFSNGFGFQIYDK